MLSTVHPSHLLQAPAILVGAGYAGGLAESGWGRNQKTWRDGESEDSDCMSEKEASSALDWVKRGALGTGSAHDWPGGSCTCT